VCTGPLPSLASDECCSECVGVGSAAGIREERLAALLLLGGHSRIPNEQLPHPVEHCGGGSGPNSFGVFYDPRPFGAGYDPSR
jgi:hypothetical protein